MVKNSAAYVRHGFLLLIFILSACTVRSIMHESDQASFLSGAWQLAQGGSVDYGTFYRYEKFFGAYWLLAGIFRLFPSADPVLSANIFSFSVFWGGLLLLYRSRGVYRSGLNYTLFLGGVCAPAVLIHVPYFAANFLSAGFLFLGMTVLRRSFWISLIFWGCAMMIRMDAVLLVPLLAWISCETRSFRGMIRSWRVWSAVGTALVVMGISSGVSPGAQAVGYVPFFNLKLFAGYTVFGLGGGLLVLGVVLWRLMRPESCVLWDERLFYWSGGAALLLPFCFYALLLFSTRHWVVCLSGMLLLICSDHWEILACFEGRACRWLKGVLALFILAPLFVGLRLPFPEKPVITCAKPTLFPTADGRCPMGALFPFLFSKDRLDHNHQLWLAAGSVPEWETLHGEVPVGASPLDTIVDFAIRTRGFIPSRPHPVDQLSPENFVYLPCRTVLKPRIEVDRHDISFCGDSLSEWCVDLVGGVFPSGLLRIRRSALDGVESEAARKIKVMRSLFLGNEFVWMDQIPSGPVWVPKEAEGGSFAFFSDTPFDVTVGREVVESYYASEEGTYVVILPGRRWQGKSIEVSESVLAARSVYPDYMRVENF